MNTSRRNLFRICIISGAGLVASCAPKSVDPACYTSEGCSPVAAEPGLNQFDMLEIVYAGSIPTDRRFAFEVLRDDKFVEPAEDEFVTTTAPEGTATERSYDPNATALYTFKEGETVVFYEVFDS